MTEVQCNNCGHEWDYQGEKTPPSEISCPECRHRRKAPEGHEPPEEGEDGD